MGPTVLFVFVFLLRSVRPIAIDGRAADAAHAASDA
jgi:hypothetical protein